MSNVINVDFRAGKVIEPQKRKSAYTDPEIREVYEEEIEVEVSYHPWEYEEDPEND